METITIATDATSPAACAAVTMSLHRGVKSVVDQGVTTAFGRFGAAPVLDPSPPGHPL